jgi:hypothetical protein
MTVDSDLRRERDTLASALRLCVELLEQVRLTGLPEPDRINRGEDASFGFWNTYQSRVNVARGGTLPPS